MRKHLPIWHHRCTSRGFRQVPDLALHHWEKLGVIGTKRKKKKLIFYFCFFQYILTKLLSHTWIHKEFWLPGHIQNITLAWCNARLQPENKTPKKGMQLEVKSKIMTRLLFPTIFSKDVQLKQNFDKGWFWKKRGKKLPN